ncbi:hypothetical protein EO087_00090 [Dyella sp. M7H15-1]|uniref:hypothetical protein n=1 Tax=Dyella sp. M7H15-1 TaxID=2501295 RepID=UPI0010050A5B|nr:hypothetical protein [Dyella sp. M7H15-1]QAU22568.1 hypothetical protein EO087_00090 [Dyella sp. M7H15-1]
MASGTPAGGGSMKTAEIKALFPDEASLCDIFIRDMRAMGGWTIYPETADFGILLVRDATGHQLGVEAKLQLNAKVASQILPTDRMGYRDGRAVELSTPYFLDGVKYLEAAERGLAMPSLFDSLPDVGMAA